MAEGPPPPSVVGKVWAGVGAMFVVFILYLLIRWVTGPYFTNVPPGPTPAPSGLKVFWVAYQIAGGFAAVFMAWRFVIRPWRANGEPSTDGLLVIGGSLLWFQDPLSDYFSPWFTYNSHLWNMGSWVSYYPGWVSHSSPGQQVPEPLMATCAYIYIWALLAMAGCAVLRRMHRKWPRLTPVQLLSGCLVFMTVFDAVLEGVIWMPLGFYQEAAAGDAIFHADKYYALPWWEPILTGVLFTMFAGLRYYKNDVGETIAERGISKLPVSKRRKNWLRVFAMIGVTQLGMLVLYNAPVTVIGAQAKWPKSIQERSYFTNGLCGEGTDRRCPGNDYPLTRGRNSIHLDPSGTLVVPKGAEVPKAIPWKR